MEEADDLTRRIPTDAFETALFRQRIEADLAKWPADVMRAELVGDIQPDGSWRMIVYQPSPPLGPSLLDTPSVDGAVWVAERDYPATESFRVAVEWRLENGQSNTGYPPVVPWLGETVAWSTSVRSLLRQRGLTHAALATELGVSTKAVQAWLYGERTPTGLYAATVRAALTAAGIKAPPKEND